MCENILIDHKRSSASQSVTFIQHLNFTANKSPLIINKEQTGLIDFSHFNLKNTKMFHDDKELNLQRQFAHKSSFIELVSVPAGQNP